MGLQAGTEVRGEEPVDHVAAAKALQWCWCRVVWNDHGFSRNKLAKLGKCVADSGAMPGGGYIVEPTTMPPTYGAPMPAPGVTYAAPTMQAPPVTYAAPMQSVPYTAATTQEPPVTYAAPVAQSAPVTYAAPVTQARAEGEGGRRTDPGFATDGVATPNTTR